jgi:ATP-dependent protease ClpP protease subunit
MKKESNGEMTLMPFLPNNKTFTTEFRGVRYDYYLTGNIGAAEDYVDLCNILRSATSQDEVIIRINSGGGSVATGNMIINAISESEANVIGFIENDCGSMATFIFLACHTWGVSESAEFFSHTCSYGAWGKEHENFTQAEFIRKQSHKQMRKRYANFLTETEIEKVIAGSDVYLDADEIMERLEGYSEARENQPCNCGDENCPQNARLAQQQMEEDEGFDLEALIETKIAEALEKATAPAKKAPAKKKPVKAVEQV